MRLIIKIAKKELSYLFYSPIAWFVLIVFIIQCGFFYFDVLSQIAYSQDMLLKNSPEFKVFPASLTEAVFTKRGFFPATYQNLYLFVPLLTMGLISREVNSGSIKLLFSSPVTTRQLVLGKYLGIMGFVTALTAVMFLVAISGMISIKHSDYGVLLSGTLGFYLLAAAYTSVGLFMSSITSNPIISGISVFVILFVLSFMGGVWQQYNFIRDLTYFLALPGRANDLANGLIVTKDIIYFLAIAALFIGFTLIKLRSSIESWSWHQKGLRYLLVVIVVLAIGYISSRPLTTGYADVTARKTNTLHPRTQQLIKQLADSAIHVTLYVNLFNPNNLTYGLPHQRNATFLKFWERYLRFKPEITFDYIYYYNKNSNDSAFQQFLANSEKTFEQIVQERAESLGYDANMFLPPDSVPEPIRLEADKCKLMMKIQGTGYARWVRLYNRGLATDQFPPSESNMYATLKQLMTEPPKIYFTTGHLERNIYKEGVRDFGYLGWTKDGLATNGFVIDTLNLAAQEIPANTDILVVADPKIPYDTKEMQTLQDYTASGKNLMIMGYPGKQSLLNPLLEQVGMQLSAGQVVMPTWDETPDKVGSYVPAEVDGFAEEFAGIKNYLQKGDTGALLRFTPSTTAIVPLTGSAGRNLTPMLKTLPQTAWVKAGVLVTDSTLPPMDTAAGDWKTSSFVTATALSRQVKGKEQRIIISGGSDLFNNKHILSDNRTVANTFFRWLNYRGNPVYMPQKKPVDTLLRFTEAGVYVQKIAYLWVLPVVLLIAGILLIVRRQRQ